MPKSRARLFFVLEPGRGVSRPTSRLWFQASAAPELWMVVSSGSGFLGKRSGCWHRLRGAEGSPHRVPWGAPAGQRKEKETLGNTQTRKYIYFVGRIQMNKNRHTQTQGQPDTLQSPPLLTNRPSSRDSFHPLAVRSILMGRWLQQHHRSGKQQSEVTK